MTQVTIYANHIQSSKNFEKRILSVLPSSIENITIIECGMERGGGYGYYNYFLAGEINGQVFNFKKHHTSSQSWDWYQDCEANRTFSNWKKNLIIDLLKQHLETL